MSLKAVSAGKNPIKEFNTVIEIPQGGDPIKYEIDKETGALFVDRVLGTSNANPDDEEFDTVDATIVAADLPLRWAVLVRD